MFLAGILFSFDKPDFDSLKSSLGKQNSKILFHQGFGRQYTRKNAQFHRHTFCKFIILILRLKIEIIHKAVQIFYSNYSNKGDTYIMKVLFPCSELKQQVRTFPLKKKNKKKFLY
jgi:hypothetical protein